MPAGSTVRTVLFYRDFRRFHGGHLKVWDYFNHVRSAPELDARIAFSERSDMGEENPWRQAQDSIVDSPADVIPDIFFVAGRDWLMVDRHPAAAGDPPVVNFVQHMRHADPASDRYEFLRRRAIRVCVSEAVADAVRATGIVEGPVFANPNSVDVGPLPPDDGSPPDVDVAIAAIKQPDRGRELARRLDRPSRRIDLLSEPLARDAYLERIRGARTTVFLPNEAEGFYLPPLEGMALGTIVVCPRHGGEQGIYEPGRNCFQPAYSSDDLVAATESALVLSSEEEARMRAAARETAARHTLDRERRGFLEILRAVDDLW